MHAAAVSTTPRVRIGGRLLAALAICALLCGAAVGAFAADAAPDPDSVEVWQRMRSQLFGARPIVYDRSVLALAAPARAQDAAVVPISISTRFAHDAARRVARLYLFIDANPSPLGAVFTFGPRSAGADIDTRVRVEDYTWMRAVAELSDGSLYADQRYVKAAGGCSAPYGTAPDFDAFRPRVRLKLGASVQPHTPVLVELMIQHPNSSGLARDQLTHLFIPPYFVREIAVTYAGELVLSAQVDFTISENPNFRFYLLAEESGELRAHAVDTKDRELRGDALIEVGR
jgi:sulfur-oxidizing protein SoxY